ncbi:v-ubiquitin [Reticulomyxa filosa]|uniref:V-ubiquitin n=1 Tax=Reticulomyxa filosa TaxID=46433 RepID=X6LTS7_RETFI|nr:v-ubiquitin [Reticulomyxa filosa]|eukprot:ETO05044.1 v-ubiquitin [Reticulomyxa filosa]
MTTNGGEGEITITIKQLDGATFSIQIIPTAQVRQLKEAVQRARDISPERQRLIYRAQELKNDENTLTDYGVVDQCTLHMVIRPLANVPPNNNANPDVVVSIAQKKKRSKRRHPWFFFVHIFVERNNVEGQDQIEHVNVAPTDINVLQIAKLSRFVRIFAILDFLILLLFGLTLSLLFFVMAVLALAGYYGAKTLKRSYLVAYIICLILEIVARAAFIYLDRYNIVSVVLLALMILIDMFVLRCVIQLFRAIAHLQPHQQEQIMVFNRIGLL